MPRGQVSVLINRPVEEVFAFTTSLENNMRWVSAAIDSGQTSEGPARVGTSGWLVLKFLGWTIESTLEITELEWNKKATVKSTSGTVPYEATWTYEPVEGGTEFTFALEIAGGLFGIFGLYKRRMQSDLTVLKELVEDQSEAET